MNGLLDAIGRRILFQFDPEVAHGLSIKALKSGLAPRAHVSDPRLQVSICGLKFPNPLGLAAGYDKNAEVPAEILRLGFGFTEVGTLTPRPQVGNPKPRIFRLSEDDAVINRLGFNNGGHDAAYSRLSNQSIAGILGVNVGANKDSENRINDYVLGIKKFSKIADYFTINVSSPNTPGLRDLQARESLTELARATCEARAESVANTGRANPIFLKIAPDLTEGALDEIADVTQASELDGLIISNTTLSRSGLVNTSHAAEAGGLSGRPVFQRSTIVLAKMRERLGPDVPLIGVGGVHDGESALAKIRAGADLVQTYTGLIYGGPGLPRKIIGAMQDELDRTGASSISESRDSQTREWARMAIPE